MDDRCLPYFYSLREEEGFRLFQRWYLSLVGGKLFGNSSRNTEMKLQQANRRKQMKLQKANRRKELKLLKENLKKFGLSMAYHNDVLDQASRFLANEIANCKKQGIQIPLMNLQNTVSLVHLMFCKVPPDQPLPMDQCQSSNTTHQDIEDNFHVFFGCSWSRHFWRLCEFPFSWSKEHDSIRKCFHIIDLTDQSIKGKCNSVWFVAGCLMYTIWFLRNQIRVKKKSVSPVSFMHLYHQFKRNWSCDMDYCQILPNFAGRGNLMLVTNTISRSIYESVPCQNHSEIFSIDNIAGKWSMIKPPPCWMVLLTDAAFDSATRTAKFGAVIVDRDGFKKAQRSEYCLRKINFSVQEAEILAVEAGLKWFR